MSPAVGAELAKRAGATVDRVTLDWRWAEAREDVYRLEVYDEIYRETLARGVRPLFILLFAPSWALAADEPCDQWTTDCRQPPGPEHYAEWREFAALVAARYPQAAGIQVWNEPNQAYFWKPWPDPRRYTDMLAEAHAAIKAVNPAMPVVSGGLANNPATSQGIPLKPYLAEMYAGGAKGNMDALAFHPYSHVEGLLEQTFDEVRTLRQAYADTGTPLWVTELGLTTSGRGAPGWPSSWVFSEEQQATELVALYRQLRSMDDVEAIMFHTLVEPPGDPQTSPGVGYGIVRKDLQPKPAFCALARERGVEAPCGTG